MKKKILYSTSIAFLLVGFVGQPIAFAVDTLNDNFKTELSDSSDNLDSTQETELSDSSDNLDSTQETDSSFSELYESENSETTTSVSTENTGKATQNVSETSVVKSAIAAPALADTGIQGNWGTSAVNYDPSTFTLTVGAGVITGEDRMSFSETVDTTKIQHLVFEQGSALDGSLDSWANKNKIQNLITVSGPVDTSGVTSMGSMFYYSRKLVSLDVSSWNTSNVINMSRMFEGAEALTNFEANHFDTSKVTDMSFLFNGAISLENVHIKDWDTSSVITMRMMFFATHKLLSLDVNSWDVSNVTNFSGMFSETRMPELDLNNWDMSSAKDINSMFYFASGIQTLHVSEWDTSNVEVMRYMFEGARSLENIDVSKWDTSKVDEMTTMFSKTNLKKLDLSNWNTEKVFKFAAFLNATPLEELTLGEKFTAFPNSKLNDINTSSPEGFTGAWIRKDGEKKYASSSAFMNEYDGSYPGTYIWAIPATIDAQDSTLYVGDDWNPEENFVSATDGAKNNRVFDDITVTEIDTVDTTKPGEYKVSYQYDDQTITVTVTVLENLATLNTKDLTIYEGDAWKAEDHFVDATMKDGSSAKFTDMSMADDQLVDAGKVGTYIFKVINGKVINDVTLNVLKDQSTIQAKDKTIYVGDSWEEKDTFVSATDRDGKALTLKDLKVSGTVNTGKAGKYPVTYTWDVTNADGTKTGKTISATGNVTVLDKKAPTKSVTDNPGKGNQVTTNGKTTTTGSRTVSSAKNLPKTGEEVSTLGILTGLGVIVLAGLGFVITKKLKNS